MNFSCLSLLKGTYLLLEKLRYATYRRLLRKVHGIHAQLEPGRQTQVPLQQFQAALAMQASLVCIRWSTVAASSKVHRPRLCCVQPC
jgi:hypothetical protein